VSFAAGVTVMGVDGDDTLWHCQDEFDAAEEHLGELLSDLVDASTVQGLMRETETRNLPVYGYGVRSFTLSAVELALSLDAPTATVQRILALGRELLASPVRPVPGAAEAVASMREHHRLVLVTKGDLLHQQRKLRDSGLRELFSHVEIVGEKHPEAYAELLGFLGLRPEEFLMVGDSERSDILPVLEVGAWAVHVPHARPWWNEVVTDRPAPHPRRRDVAALGELVGLLSP
jgi:putative hydrolase of the HAD superfamily